MAVRMALPANFLNLSFSFSIPQFHVVGKRTRAFSDPMESETSLAGITRATGKMGLANLVFKVKRLVFRATLRGRVIEKASLGVAALCYSSAPANVPRLTGVVAT
jgi:hypothetical protein